MPPVKKQCLPLSHKVVMYIFELYAWHNIIQPLQYLLVSYAYNCNATIVLSFSHIYIAAGSTSLDMN